AMLRDTLHASGGDTARSLSLRVAKHRLGHDIAPGDTSTADGEAHLQGTLGTLPLNIWLNKYSGPSGGQKGMRIGLLYGR
ncbi:oxidoreductase, partial [Klebsiella pneumoniae]|nr:oxidoreductase [Klebsiella pneumoniae]